MYFFLLMFKRSRLVLSQLFDNHSDYIDKDVKVCGWIETIRVQQKNGLAFISMNDGSCCQSLQIILNSEEPESNNFDTIYNDGTKGVSISVSGKIVESPAKGQTIELKCSSLKILGKVDTTSYPIAKSKLKLDYIRQYPHLRIRTKTIASVARIRDTVSFATHTFFKQNGVKYVHTPIFTGNDCEGAGETFEVSNMLGQPGNETPFFGKTTSLTVSGQLHGETYACGLSDIYTFGPTFRAEDSHTTRHLSEFWMIEPELCFIDFKSLIDIAEDYVRFCVKTCLYECNSEIEFFTKHYQPELKEELEKLVNTPFTRMTYKEVIQRINNDIECGLAIIRDPTLEHKKFKKIARGKHIFEGPVGTYDKLLPLDYDLDSEHEKYMTSKVGGPLVVTDFPAKIKSFYMKPTVCEDIIDGIDEIIPTVQAMDILVPNIGELVGGSMREDDYDVLKDKMDNLGISIPWYLDLRKYGSVPHGGFGLGFERLIMYITGIYNIKDVIPYPRYPGHCDM
jgi:asparaginyl-tRNA synthetase